MIHLLGQNRSQVCVACIPEHVTQGVSSQTAHNAARGGLQSTPPLIAPYLAPGPSLHPRLQLDHARPLRRKRLSEKTLQDYLHGVPTLPRSAEVFVNNAIANAILTTVTLQKLQKLLHLNYSASPYCPHCQQNVFSGLKHLTWYYHLSPLVSVLCFVLCHLARLLITPRTKTPIFYMLYVFFQLTSA